MDDADRSTYLNLLSRNLADAEVRVLAWCLMRNHVHLVVVPGRDDSLAVLFRRVHGRYAQYYNARYERTGHLWQNRFYACALGPGHLWSALAYVENNPVRAGLVTGARQYRWSSALAHLGKDDHPRLLDMQFWRDNGGAETWARFLAIEEPERHDELQRCTYSGKPFGDDSLVREVSERFGRYWTRGRPRAAQAAVALGNGTPSRGQGSLFAA